MNKKEIVSKNKSGFTLIELVIVLAIGSVIFIVVTLILIRGFQFNLIGFSNYNAQSDAIVAINKSASEIRQATGVVSASSQSITIQEYLNTTDTAPAQVRFYLNGNDFIKGTILPTGTGPAYTYDPATETTKIVINNVQNGASAVYSYYDQNNTLLSSPYVVGNITLVKISLTLGDSKLRTTFTATTQAQLRFKKTNL